MATANTTAQLSDCNDVTATGIANLGAFCAKLKAILDIHEAGQATLQANIDTKASHVEANTFFLLWAGAPSF